MADELPVETQYATNDRRFTEIMEHFIDRTAQESRAAGATEWYMVDGGHGSAVMDDGNGIT